MGIAFVVEAPKLGSSLDLDLDLLREPFLDPSAPTAHLQPEVVGM